MATLQVTGYADLVNATKVDYGPQDIQQIAQNYVDYPLFQTFFKKDRMDVSDGQLIQRNLQIKKSPVARFKGMMQPDAVNIENITVQSQVPWRFADAHWGFTNQEVHLNRGKSRIFKLIDSTRANAYIDMIEMLEAALWQAPATTDSKSIYGVPYYVVKNSSTGFNGGHPGSHSSVANVSSTTYANWKNYTAYYTAVTKADLIKKCRTACRLTKFRGLEGLNLGDYRKSMDRYCLFTNEAVAASLEDVGEAQNENLGRDLASMQVQTGGKDVYRLEGALTFRRYPIVYAPYLDGDSGNPVYGLDMSTFVMFVHENFNMKEGDVKEIGDNHDAFVVWLDLWCNLLCVDRRRNFVITVS